MGRRPPGFCVPTIGLREQRALVEQKWRNFRCEMRGGLLICVGEVTPTPVSQRYSVRIEYRAKKQPSVRVEEPPLRRRHGASDQPIPHTYNASQPGRERPCLYQPASREWRPDRLLADTIIPWLYEWLAHYEIWHVTGEWHGGGMNHDGRKQ